jgi:hypothetical protein
VSYRIGIDTLNLRPAPRLAHTEYCSNERLKQAVTGLPPEDPAREREFMRLWDVDFIWSTPGPPVPWEQRGRTTDMGHAEFLEGGTDWRLPKSCPFVTPEDVWAFDAVAEYGLEDHGALVRYYEGLYQDARRDYPEQVWTGGYYPTIYSGAIAAFGWDMLLLAAADARRFARVIDSIYRYTMHQYLAWAETSIEFFMCHDDMVWTQGPFMSPSFYRSEVFPRFQALWAVLHKAGKKVVFTSDGDYSMFVDDIVAAGADVLCFEPMTALEPVVAKYGQTHGIISSKVDARTLTFGSEAQIAAEVDATVAAGKQCKGFMCAVGNHIPSNVPVERALFYMDYLRRHWSRSA